jgi:hypothetical protein
MSDAYERERWVSLLRPCNPLHTQDAIPLHTTPLHVKLIPPSQNNNRLDDLASKVSALRGVTIDIYDNARDQGVIDSTVLSLCLPL